MSILPSGFKSLPITKLLIFLTAVPPLILSLSSLKYLQYLEYEPFITSYSQYWRIVTSQLAFINESEVLLSVVLLYQFKSIERFVSSYRYISLVIILWFYNILITSLIILLDTWFDGVGLAVIPQQKFCSGPITVILGLYAIYKQYVPIVYTFQLYYHRESDYSVTLNDQFVASLLSLQLILSQGWCSIWAGITGYIVAWLLINGILPGLRWRVPFYKLISRWINGKNTTASDSFTQTNNGNIRGNDGAMIDGRLRGSPNEEEEEEEEEDDHNTVNRDDEDPAETRPLASQFLDTFRR